MWKRTFRRGICFLISSTKMYKSLLPVVLSVVLVLAAACSSEDSNDNPVETITLETAVTHAIDSVVIPSYRELVKEEESYYSRLSDAEYASLTQSQLEAICKLFLHARSRYECTEAFFFGADAHFYVDADINQWPLDVIRCRQLLSSNAPLEDMSDWDASIVGWHGIEYVLFRNGSPRKVADITEREWKYLQTLSRNLRLRCLQLLCGWDKDAPQIYRDLLTAARLEYTSPHGNDYRTYMLAAYTPLQNFSAMLIGDHGLMGLSDEIADTKLGRPYNNNDANYIESPYSYQSVNDLVYNVKSIKNLWSALKPYVSTVSADKAKEVDTAIDNLETALKLIKSPFAQHIRDAEVSAAIEKSEALSKILDETNELVTKIKQ